MTSTSLNLLWRIACDKQLPTKKRDAALWEYMRRKYHHGKTGEARYNRIHLIARNRLAV